MFDTASSGTSAAAQKTRGNPLAAGLIAFGAGALLGSLVPPSMAEQRAAAAVKDQAQPLTDNVTEAAKSVASELREQAREAADSVETAASDAADTVKDEAQSTAGDIKAKSADATGKLKDAD